MVKDIDQVLEETLKKLNLDKKIKERKALIIWKEVIGDKLKKHTKASYINQGILFVLVNSSTWAHQLLFLKSELISRLNNRLGQEIVKDIRFKLGSISEEESLKVEENYDLSEIELTSDDLKEINDSIKNIDDSDLSERIYSVMVKDKKVEKWKLNNGWKRCKYCSALHPDDAEGCMICQLKSGKQLGKIEKILLENPWLTYKEVNEIYPEILISDYNRIKEKLIDKFWREIEDRISDVVRRQKPKLNQKFKVLIQYYVMLKEQVHPRQLNRDIIKEVIGSNYIKIYDKL